MFRIYVCHLLKHRIDRHRVWNDGLDFRTACARCGTPLLRDPQGWRKFYSERDANPVRKPHPRDSGQ